VIGWTSVSLGQVTEVRQNSIPEAMTPSTSRLLFNGVVTDAGVSVELFRLQGEGLSGRLTAGGLPTTASTEMAITTSMYVALTEPRIGA